MDAETFRRHAHDVVDWVADYLENSQEYPVLSRVVPGEVKGRLPVAPPDQGEPMERILASLSASTSQSSFDSARRVCRRIMLERICMLCFTRWWSSRRRYSTCRYGWDCPRR